jgi:hypothetical protein
MTTMVISTMTFSWCEQVAPSTAAGVSTVGQSSTQGGGSTIANPMSPSSGPGGYEFDSAPVGQRSPAKNDILHSPVVRAPSTFATIIIPSRSREEEFLPSETAFCGSPSDLGNFTQNVSHFSPLRTDVKALPLTCFSLMIFHPRMSRVANLSRYLNHITVSGTPRASLLCRHLNPLSALPRVT